MILTPEPYQETFTAFLRERDRAAGFVGVGLGKTAATLCAHHDNILDGVSKAALVVAPLRVANLTWHNEVAKWDRFKNMRIESIRGTKPSGRAQIYTINYERLGELKNLDFCDTVIFDELTRAKNHKSERIYNFRPLLTPRHKRWGLTGTPRPNSILELFAQIRLLDDGARLGPSFDAFQKGYCEAVDFNEYKWRPKPGMEKLVYEKIHDLALTLKSSDYLDIPNTTVEDVAVPLPSVAHSIYKRLERDLMVSIGEREQVVIAPNAGVLVNKLLQICGGAVYDENRAVIDIHHTKLAALARITLERPTENILIFTNYIHERERVVASLAGAVDASKFKGDIEDAWNSGKIKYLVADPRSLGHGLNLQAGGRTIVWYSPTWSRELYDQANGRLARKGQQEISWVYRIACSGTMDDAVLETLRVRGDEQGAMLDLLTNFRKLGLVFN